MLKVFKVLKVASSLNEWDDDPTIVVLKDMKRFGSLITGVFFMAHYAACAFSLAAMGNEKGWNAKTWVAHYYNDGYAMKHDELGSDWATSWEADDGLKPLERHSHHTRAFPTPMRVYCVRAPRAVFVLLYSPARGGPDARRNIAERSSGRGVAASLAAAGSP